MVCDGEIRVSLTHDDSTSIFNDHDGIFGRRCCVDEHWEIRFKLGWLPTSSIKRFRGVMEKLNISIIILKLHFNDLSCLVNPS